MRYYLDLNRMPRLCFPWHIRTHDLEEILYGVDRCPMPKGFSKNLIRREEPSPQRWAILRDNRTGQVHNCLFHWRDYVSKLKGRCAEPKPTVGTGFYNSRRSPWTW